MPGSYRADYVGSLLRPDEIKQARASFNAEGKMQINLKRSRIRLFWSGRKAPA